jgi:hypothetical protein
MQRQISKIHSGLLGKDKTIAEQQAKSKQLLAELNEALYHHEEKQQKSSARLDTSLPNAGIQSPYTRYGN